MAYSNSTVHYFVNTEKGWNNLIWWWAQCLDKSKDNPYALRGSTVGYWLTDLFFIYPDGRETVLHTGDRVTYKDGHFDVIQHNYDR